MITEAQLKSIMPYASKSNITKFVEPLNKAMQEFDITTPLRQAMFVAQVAHESGSLVYVKEISNGNQYDTRTDLGNTKEVDGDGAKTKGRGLIQITGTTNYIAIGKYFGVDFIANPELLETPEYAARSAGWFWMTHKLNQYADIKDINKSTKIINGGTNGLKERIEFYNRALAVIK